MSKRKTEQQENGEASGEIALVPTGVLGLDEIIGGGIAKGAFIMVMGEPGTGKTVLLQQMAFYWARHVDPGSNRIKALYFSTLSEAHEKLIAHMRRFAFYEERLISSQLEFLSLQDAMRQGVEKIAETVVNTARQRKAGLVMIDGFRALAAAIGDSSQTATLLTQLAAQLNFLGCTMLVAIEATYGMNTNQDLLTTTDGIIALGNYRHGVQRLRQIEVPKMRGAAQMPGQHSYEITNSGVQVYPRLEASIAHAGLPTVTVVPEGRRAFGIAAIDQLMQGGLPQGSATMLVGAPSTGKTLLALHFLSDGAQQGQAGLMLSFDETRQQLFDKANRFGLTFGDAVQGGTMRLHNIAPVELDPNKITNLIRQEVEQYNIKRLVIDGIDTLERTTQHEGRAHDYIAAIVSYLRSRGVTLIVNKHVPRITGAELDLGDIPMALIGENLILLRYGEKDSRLYRTLLVLKMRDSEYDQTIREFSITGDGIKVQ